MRVVNILTEPFELVDIEVCTINKKLNDHFHAAVTGYIRTADDEQMLASQLKAGLVIQVLTDTGKRVCLFRGNITKIVIETIDTLIRVQVEAVSRSIELDKVKHTRVFQGQRQTYRQIVKSIQSGYQNADVLFKKGGEETAEGLVLQYQETDWEFFKRLASQLHTVIAADHSNSNINFFFGNPYSQGEADLSVIRYRIACLQNEDEREFREITVTSRDIANLCESVDFMKQEYGIYEISTNMIQGELIFEYKLRHPLAFSAPRFENHQVKGISLFGTVTDVEDVRVRVRLSCEADHDFGKSLWFPFSTVYSSPDGTGWFCMPEIGDRVRLHVPDCEGNAYVISAVHLENDHELRNNPDHKSIRTKYNKEIRFTPDQIVITNHRGLSIVLDDEEGITMNSNKKIDIKSESGIDIKGEQIKIVGSQGIYLTQGSNYIVIKDGIKEQADRIVHR